MAENNLTLSIVDFAEGASIPAKYTCRGSNISPALAISGVPPNTQSLVVIAHDPDAPAGDFTHWLMWNIPANTTDIPEDNVPVGIVQGKNDAGGIGYLGPCPPSGIHRYIFALYALNRLIDLSNGGTRSELQDRMNGHVIAQTTLMGLFGQQ